MCTIHTTHQGVEAKRTTHLASISFQAQAGAAKATVAAVHAGDTTYAHAYVSTNSLCIVQQYLVAVKVELLLQVLHGLFVHLHFCLLLGQRNQLLQAQATRPLGLGLGLGLRLRQLLLCMSSSGSSSSGSSGSGSSGTGGLHERNAALGFDYSWALKG